MVFEKKMVHQSQGINNLAELTREGLSGKFTTAFLIPIYDYSSTKHVFLKLSCVLPDLYRNQSINWIKSSVLYVQVKSRASSTALFFILNVGLNFKEIRINSVLYNPLCMIQFSSNIGENQTIIIA